MMGTTKAVIAEQVKAKHLAVAAGTPDAELLAWSKKVFAELQDGEKALLDARNRAKELEAARKEARGAHRRAFTAEASTAWRESVTAADEAQTALRDARENRNRLQALSELLAQLLRQRTRNNAETAAGGFFDGTTDAAAKGPRRPAPPESCPFCCHSYTVRDGTLAQTDAEGNRLQLRKCQCREMAPPCRNCPICKEDPDVMAADGDSQLQLCREVLRCEVCACECPGAGKWIESDHVSRERFKERTAKRHAELSALLQSSWGGGDAAEGSLATCGGGVEESGEGPLPPLQVPRRLPADIKNQIEAVVAAQSLQFSAMETVAGPSGAISRSDTEHNHHHHGGGGRSCCGEALTTTRKRRRGAEAPPPAPQAPQQVQQQQQPAGASCGDAGHSHHEHCAEHDHHHAAEHVHRCHHPHTMCTSSCCSAVSHA